MRRCAPCLLTLLCVAVASPPAEARVGLYVPFPTGGPGQQARGYLKRLGPSGRSAAGDLSSRQIAAGSFLGAAPRGGARPASQRAGDIAHKGPAWPFQLLVVLAPLGAVLVARRN
jgi:hypothetical protein